MALTQNTPRAYEEGFMNDLPVKASSKIYEGSLVGKSSGYARALVAGDVFMGIAARGADNSAGANGDINVRVRKNGTIQVAVTGVTAVTDEGATVYASDDGTFTLSSTGNSVVGKIIRWVSGTTCVVYFEAASVRSI